MSFPYQPPTPAMTMYDIFPADFDPTEPIFSDHDDHDQQAMLDFDQSLAMFAPLSPPHNASSTVASAEPMFTPLLMTMATDIGAPDLHLDSAATTVCASAASQTPCTAAVATTLVTGLATPPSKSDADLCRTAPMGPPAGDLPCQRACNEVSGDTRPVLRADEPAVVSASAASSSSPSPRNTW
ncbi:hypothetical protein THASP1DRAFT_31112 [Thamnocephalis sphaerospora]|uniref:Uncharacterized protein n=1 Tax=Thamnocephalis sphaerospora TaxID=78915 RepID=A0A4P9XME2_9FUNG|nr:hypothetical protein THASP1DRAFT_31112 [Thamnocephalis sphaerospora]|eukprot:RKP07074.1 hypothetical protein THASP1DRAFT_31112 [Thamnocephalis sphaerospora]